MPGLENLSRGWYTLRPPGTAVEETEKPTTRSRRNPDKNAYRGNNKRDFAGDGSGPFSSRQKKKSTQMTRLPFSSDQLHRSSQYASFGSLILERSIAFVRFEDDENASPIAHQDEILRERKERLRLRRHFLVLEIGSPTTTHPLAPWLGIYLWPTEIRSPTNLA
ncbi:hypothetical protein PSHT_01891, partial [Puccinia striiformis]